MTLLKNILLLFTAVLILLPTGVSFSHIFADHGHKLCDNYADEHYHDKSLDCELHKFQKNPIISLDFQSFQFAEVFYTSTLTYDYYRFLNDYEPLCYELRGPPALSITG
ncbi:hypothetical protein [Gramella sp. Hel_I_59]|uniref:hypothetical protein n=1 Tax=Gramella sp. Hel_I_59 TaxID=1249978 RepID=UPI00115488FD|nr:hypothetical protein [Gramella sp. Hel_I_59]